MNSIHKKMALVVPALLVMSGIASAAPVAEGPPHDRFRPLRVASGAAYVIDTGDRQAVERKYLQKLVPAREVPMGWTGNVSTCDAGQISTEAQAAALDAVNFFRAMTHLDPVSFDPGLSANAQQAALMMDANNQLNHFPPTDWACYSAQGAETAGKSNLAAVPGAEAIVRAMANQGSQTAGNRRWVIYPPLSTMGHGSTSSYDALQVIGTSSGGMASPDWVPWPTSGYFPQPLEPNGLWSLSTSRSDIDFSTATVKVTNASGNQLPVEVYSPMAGFGLPTLVWKVSNLTEPTATSERRFKVVVGHIGDTDTGGFISHQYQVRLFKPLDQHAINATLALSRHLFAVIKLQSPSLAACTRHGVVLIQRRAGNWVTVRRIDPPHDSSMRIRIPDRAGTYRVTARGLVVDGTDRCLSSTSNVVRHRHH